MPRPPYKRPKLNHPTPSKRVSKPSNVPPIVELQQKLASKPIGRVLTDSDDSDRLVTSNSNGRNRRGIPRKDIYASGGVGRGDVPGAHTSQTQNLQASQKLVTRQNAGQGKQAAINQQVKAGRIAKSATGQQKQVAEVAEKPYPPIQTSPRVPGLTSVIRAPNRPQTTPRAEASILGNLRPRRRQPSILQQLEDQDTSNISEEDEDDFLPNDESTPLHHLAAQPASSTSSSSSSLQSISRKRKLSPSITLIPASHALKKPIQLNKRPDTSGGGREESEPELPPSRSVNAPQRVTPEPIDPNVMAPPLSSSPLKSPPKPSIFSPVNKPLSKGSKQPAAPSTSELRALLPARRQGRSRLRTRALSEFDIPADSESDSSSAPASEEDDSRFGAGPKSRKSKPAIKTKAKPAKKPMNPARTEGKDRGRRDKSTLSPSNLVTPRKRPTAAAKPFLLSQQRPGHVHGSSATPREKGKAAYSYSSRRRAASGGKENRPGNLSGNFSDAGVGNSDGGDYPVEQSIEDAQTKIKPTKELRQMAKKFADVDEWEMEFEDVSLTGNSSPNRR